MSDAAIHWVTVSTAGLDVSLWCLELGACVAQRIIEYEELNPDGLGVLLTLAKLHRTDGWMDGFGSKRNKNRKPQWDFWV